MLSAQDFHELSPIVLFTYNRPWHTQQTVEALRKNELAAESELIVFSDGPKITGFKRLQIYENEKKCGLANSIIDGVTSVSIVCSACGQNGCEKCRCSNRKKFMKAGKKTC